MRRKLRDGDRSRHGEAIFQQRPVEGFAIEGDQHRALGQMCCDFVQYGVLFAKIAHEELLDLQSAGVPPGQSDQKRIGARAAREAGGFGVEEKPFGWIG